MSVSSSGWTREQRVKGKAGSPCCAQIHSILVQNRVHDLDYIIPYVHKLDYCCSLKNDFHVVITTSQRAVECAYGTMQLRNMYVVIG